MKKILGLCFMLSVCACVFGQNNVDTIPPYMKYNGIPSFKIMLSDSSWFTSTDIPKGKPFVLVYFSPTCHHCQMTANEFAGKMDEMKDVFFLWVCYHTPEEIKTFAHDYNLEKFDNIKLGRDVSYFFPPYYKIQTTPFVAAYDKNGKMLESFPSGTDPDTLIALFKK